MRFATDAATSCGVTFHTAAFTRQHLVYSSSITITHSEDSTPLFLQALVTLPVSGRNMRIDLCFMLAH